MEWKLSWFNEANFINNKSIQLSEKTNTFSFSMWWFCYPFFVCYLNSIFFFKINGLTSWSAFIVLKACNTTTIQKKKCSGSGSSLIFQYIQLLLLYFFFVASCFEQIQSIYMTATYMDGCCTIQQTCGSGPISSTILLLCDSINEKWMYEHRWYTRIEQKIYTHISGNHCILPKGNKIKFISKINCCTHCIWCEKKIWTKL